MACRRLTNTAVIWANPKTCELGAPMMSVIAGKPAPTAAKSVMTPTKPAGMSAAGPAEKLAAGTSLPSTMPSIGLVKIITSSQVGPNK